ncbi:AlpA family phage regulatory protein [Desulfogranum marinum]|uniref:helix-turn-helix transcriptional regulator n=1 Tax=Desulfogranum marinum TaxID=453220 RepID=UPI0029C68756|nr:AlpA family phage regulatory protein [Desulfogranum marinum]
MVDQIYRRKEVLKMIGISNSTLYEWISAGDFPKSIKMGKRSVGWLESDLNNWIESKRG